MSIKVPKEVETGFVWDRSVHRGFIERSWLVGVRKGWIIRGRYQAEGGRVK